MTRNETLPAGTLDLGGDLSVGRLGFGAMRLCGPGVWGEPEDPKNAERVLRRAVDLGVTFIDTADAYGPGVSERLIFSALHPYPDNVVIATKGGYTRQGPGRWRPTARPHHPPGAGGGGPRRGGAPARGGAQAAGGRPAARTACARPARGASAG